MKYVAALTPASLPAVTEADADGLELPFSADVDALLSISERARRIAWIAHIESTLGDLVVRCRHLFKFHIVLNLSFSQAHAFYTVPANYAGVMHPTLSSFYKIPQSYYVPRRIRQAYQARLEVNGFWTTAEKESEPEKPKRFGEKEEAKKDDPKQTFKDAFQRERVSPSPVVLQSFKQSFGLTVTGLGKVTRSL